MCFIDALENRRLFAGLTLITHGYNGNITGWVSTAAEDIAARAGGTNFASIYTMTVERSGGSLAVTSFGADAGQKDYRNTLSAEAVVKLDWSSVSGGDFTTGSVASVVNDYLLAAHGTVPPLAQLPIHLIGHSRGASLMSALSRELGEAGVWVDQVTSLDPHPVDGKNDFLGISFGDEKMASYSNVAFADDYWRTDGDANNSDFDGEPVPGAYQGNLNNTVQKNFFVSAHGAVTAYYVGTIDTNTLDGGDHPVLPVWYPGGKTGPIRTATGFAFSRLGARTRPASGVSSLLGGAAARTAVDTQGSQWGNAFNFTYRSNATISAGTTVATQFFVADRDSSVRVDVYLDADQNPYDGATLLTGKTLPSSSLLGGRVNVPTSSISAGSYYLAARSTDSAGHVRWAYTPNKLTVIAPNFAAVTGGVLVVTGTGGADKITLTQTGTTVTATLNGGSQSFALSGISSIEVMAGAGNDVIDASAMSRAIYVNAGPGRDNVVGGSGNDTLSGGAQSNTLTGGAGDDLLNGSAGNDLLVGNGGYDRLYSNGGNDTLVGGSNADRLFGGDGADSMIGGTGNDKMYAYGGNDTLIGGAGSDIADGGIGTDSSENDPLDLRTSIEVLI